MDPEYAQHADAGEFYQMENSYLDDAVERAEKAYVGLLVPMCGYCGGICHEMKPCFV